MTTGPYTFSYSGLTSLEISATGSFDPDMDSLSYEWDILDNDDNDNGPGDYDYSWESGSIPFADVYSIYGMTRGNSYPIRLKVTAGGDSDEVTTQVTIQNSAPDAVAIVGLQTEYEIYLKDGLQLQGTGGDPDPDDDANITWDWDINGNGTWDLSGVSDLEFIPWSTLSGLGMSAGTYTVKARTNDGELYSSVAEATLRIKKPEVSVSFVDSTMKERKPTSTPDPGMVRFTRTGPAIGNLNVSYSTATGIGLATSGSDFSPLGTVTILNGDSYVDIPVSIINDTGIEGDETITVSVVTSADHNVDPMGMSNIASATIYDNDFWDWDTPLGTAVSSSDDEDWSEGGLNYHLDATYSIGAATNNSVTGGLSGNYTRTNTSNEIVEIEMITTPAWTLEFSFHAISGAISPFSSPTSASVSESGVLKGGLPVAWSVNDAAHTVTVTVQQAAVVVGGSYSVSVGADYGWTGSASTTETWGRKLELSVTVFTLRLKQVQVDD